MSAATAESAAALRLARLEASTLRKVRWHLGVIAVLIGVQSRSSRVVRDRSGVDAR